MVVKDKVAPEGTAIPDGANNKKISLNNNKILEQAQVYF